MLIEFQNYINSDAGGYDDTFGQKVSDMISNANSDGRDEELDWLIDTAGDLSGRYGNDWRGDAANGEGHGSAQYMEYFNLMETMQNGGNWDVLGSAMDANGDEFVGDVAEDNDGTGGAWGGFSSADQDAWIATLDGDTMGGTWVADNQGANNKYQENYDQQFGYREPPPTGPPAETTTIASVIIGVGQASFHFLSSIISFRCRY